MTLMSQSQLAALYLLDPRKCERKLLNALAHTQGNVSEAARNLEISMRTMQRWMKRIPSLRPYARGLRHHDTHVIEKARLMWPGDENVIAEKPAFSYDRDSNVIAYPDDLFEDQENKQ